MISGSPGILDPCEKEPCDVLSVLTVQQREDITLSAQVKTYAWNVNQEDFHWL